MTVIWFRRDLRIEDNPALTAAVASGRPVIALYISSPAQWQHHHVAPIQLDLTERALNLLSHQLAGIGIPLHHLVVPWYRDIPAALQQFCHQHQSQRVFANRDHEVNESQRDQQVAASGVELSLHHGDCLVPPGSVTTGSDTMYRVFTPFRRRWLQKVQLTLADPLPAPVAGPPVASSALIRLPVDSVCSGAWEVSAEGIGRLLAEFVDHRVDHYHQQRDLPAVDGTSRLSPYLALGMISPRQCLHQLLQRAPWALEHSASGPFTWLSELAWREFYRHLIVAWPKLCKGKNFNPLGDNIQWNDRPDLFQAWCQGRTGYPLVDAGMRQLQHTGWMHNRLRMVTASFLSKNLLIDWRLGERWFSQHLIDGDFAANNGGWQWCASTGCDAQPYFRLFNPIRQSEKFDPQGDFIRRYVPELSDLDNKMIHMPSDRQRPADYPAPVVDYRQSRELALSRFSVMKKGK
ncbi:deoxyribodipyrimidine photo-lyase type I [Ferrimonas sediminum]|uniref:Deoxyribodipyrimidine photo-lyase n=1 Tax=Ferrimonas sediminum TaxID=718193 RepID=A0A1G8VJS3_9GAMM|nr:deoxyribodipyrimidine photo-lyase [Ferrimonas sediminum]SDJ66184.1 deoxyribodipyrimidine photo-lyase type I [Ferrimonas sediminum]